MKTALLALLVACVLVVPVLAQTPAGDHAGHHVQAPAAAPADTDMTEGEVRRVDKEAGKLTLRHGEIKGLDMPPMTMVFQVRDKAMLDELKPGDKVKFKAVSESGAFIVTEIRPMR